MLFCVIVVGFFVILSNIAQASEQEKIQLSKDDWHLSGHQDKAKTKALQKAIVAWQEAWVRRDIEACQRLLTENVLMVSQNQARILSGRDEVIAALPREWEYYETDDQGASALQGTLRHVYVETRDNTALVRYYLDVTGGNRWSFDDTAALTQIFIHDEKQDKWQLAFSADVWNLDYDTDSEQPGQAVFAYDYAMPVQNLARAVKFYQPLLGAPEASTKNVAVFEMKGSRLYLVTTDTVELARPRKGLPNGWPILTPPHFNSAKNNAEKQGVEFLAKERDFAGMTVLYGYEPSGNLVALARFSSGSATAQEPVLRITGTLSGDKLPSAIATADKQVWTAWTKGKVNDIVEYSASNIALLDTTHTRTQGWAVGEKKVRQRLSRTFGRSTDEQNTTNWQTRYPFVEWDLSEGNMRQIGAWVVVTRRISATGAPPWQRRLEALDTRVFAANSATLAVSLTVNAGRPRGLAIEFDYAGIPVTPSTWAATDKALRALTGGADNYKDEYWKGFWGERAVLGMFETEPETDKIPRDQEASTYLSLLVSNVETAMTHLKAAGAKFPVIPAINSKSGISKHPGYHQVLFTDSEGNAVVLTQYTGRSTR
ncbi:hypothetical protein TPSD3_15495 [Thioflexithrix psekupsensis]|uniref:DUF4440 domain-containing protein n=2 Tax=Thioflexithrix psekupsensis TaxID=1570016 RepID=A0A251X5M2_9GAMM|nr:hypothetical protein TPSD3_15495 [Thioflexithrix psekupsensis]